MKPWIAVAYWFLQLLNQPAPVMCMDAQMPRAQDAQERLCIGGQ